MAKLFISYARSTATRARQIADLLREQGHDVWIDDQLLAHRAFSETIEEQLKTCDAVVVIWSAEAARSDWVRSEANRGREAGKLVQVRLEKAVLPMPFDQIHCIDLSPWPRHRDAPAWRSLAESLKAVVGPKARPARGEASSGARRAALERRQVTALYLGLMDWASLSARLDPEDLLEIVDAFQMTVDDVVAQHGGAVARRDDQGMLAYFGYPRAHEEDGANAVLAGLAICEGVAALQLPHEAAVRAHAGVATGLVLIQADGAGEARVTGDALNLASRMAAFAPTGGVIVSEATLRITEGMFDYREMGPVTPDGYDTAVSAFEAVGTTRVASRSHARGWASTVSLFGRDAQVDLLRELWKHAGAGHGQVVLVQGEGGIGKSRLVDSFRHAIDESEATQTAWFCGPKFSASALHPFSDGVQRAAGFARGDSMEARGARLQAFLDSLGIDEPEAFALFSDLVGLAPAAGSPTETMTPDRRRSATLDLILTLMDRLSQGGPALFVIEDLHWADPTTLELLTSAVRGAADRAWLILATARPDFECDWFDQADVAHVELGRLQRVDAERVCAQVDAAGVLPPDLVRRIVERADGVPLFLEELTRSMVEAVAGAGDTEQAARLAVPETLQDSLIARLDRLGPARQVARMGAAIGRTFTYELIAAVAGQGAAELRQSLRDLVRSGLVDCTGLPPTSTYVFRHALICDAAYESLPKAQREALHARIAQAMRELASEDVHPALLADHLTRGGAPAEAIPIWAMAGQQAAARAAHREAVGYLRTALELLRAGPRDPASIGVELQLLIALAVSLGAARGYHDAQTGAVLAEARAICDALGNTEQLFMVFRALNAFSVMGGDLDSGEDFARRCVQIADATGRVEHLLQSESALGYVLFTRGDMSPARTHLERAVTLYEQNDGASLPQLQPNDALILALGPLLMVLFAMDDEVGASRVQRRLIAHARAVGGSFGVVNAQLWRSLFFFISGDFTLAIEAAEEVIGLCDEFEYPAFRPSAALNRAFSIAHLGEAEVGLRQAREALAELDRLRQKHPRAAYLSQLAGLELLAGDAEGALATMAASIDMAEGVGEAYWLSPSHRLRAEILTRLPQTDPGEARAALADALEVARRQGAPRFIREAEAAIAGGAK